MVGLKNKHADTIFNILSLSLLLFFFQPTRGRPTLKKKKKLIAVSTAGVYK